MEEIEIEIERERGGRIGISGSRRGGERSSDHAGGCFSVAARRNKSRSHRRGLINERRACRERRQLLCDSGYKLPTRRLIVNVRACVFPLVPLSPCLFTLFPSVSLSIYIYIFLFLSLCLSLSVLQGENNRETRVHRRWPVIHEHA